MKSYRTQGIQNQVETQKRMKRYLFCRCKNYYFVFGFFFPSPMSFSFVAALYSCLSGIHSLSTRRIIKCYLFCFPVVSEKREQCNCLFRARNNKWNNNVPPFLEAHVPCLHTRNDRIFLSPQPNNGLDSK